jgi:hypothetical protein
MYARALRVPGQAGDGSTTAMHDPREVFLTTDSLPPSVAMRNAE